MEIGERNGIRLEILVVLLRRESMEINLNIDVGFIVFCIMIGFICYVMMK